MESQIRIAADNNRMVPIYDFILRNSKFPITSDNRETKTDLQLPTLPFGRVAYAWVDPTTLIEIAVIQTNLDTTSWYSMWSGVKMLPRLDRANSSNK